MGAGEDWPIDGPTFSFRFFPTGARRKRRGLLDACSRLGGLSPTCFSIACNTNNSAHDHALSVIRTLYTHNRASVTPRVSYVNSSGDRVTRLLSLCGNLNVRHLITLHNSLPSNRINVNRLPFTLSLIGFVHRCSNSRFHVRITTCPRVRPRTHDFRFSISGLIGGCRTNTSTSVARFFCGTSDCLCLHSALRGHNVSAMTRPLITNVVPVAGSDGLMHFTSDYNTSVPHCIHGHLTSFNSSHATVHRFNFSIICHLYRHLVTRNMPTVRFCDVGGIRPGGHLIRTLKLATWAFVRYVTR